jgi:hypothetical protein
MIEAVLGLPVLAGKIATGGLPDTGVSAWGATVWMAGSRDRGPAAGRAVLVAGITITQRR